MAKAIEVTETVFLTGATGFVGQEILQRLTSRPEVSTICLVRGETDAEAASRLELQPGQGERVRVIAGDLTTERFGWSTGRWDEIAAGVTRIIHCGASVSWSLPLEEARRINVDGTRQVLQLARAANHLRKLDYISTCFVCGKRQGLIPEEELDDSLGFFNTYEQSKHEAEREVRAARDSLPVCIFRLPMVVGDSRTGYASSFKVMYWPLKVLSRGLVWVVAADPRGIVDMVPVDYLCDAIELLSADPAQRGKTFHVAAGPEYGSTVGEVLELASRALGVRKPLLVRPSIFIPLIRPILSILIWGKRRELMKKGRVYLPYFQHKALFDTAQVRAALAPRGLHPPPAGQYFQKLVEYAIKTDWGKRR